MLFLLIIILLTTGAINAQTEIPVYAPCAERGYTVEGDYCIFPDGEKCLLTAFNDNTCGKSYYFVEYCIPEGNQLWQGKCCDRLVPYKQLDKTTCQPKSKMTVIETYRMLKPFIWLGVIIVVIIMFKLKSRKPKGQV